MQTPSETLLLMFRHAWLLFVIVTFINGVVWWVRAQPRIAENPRLRDGYRRLIIGWLIYGNIPWLVMGTGILSGAVPSTLLYFNPRNGPFVIAFYASVVALWIATFYWLFFKQGAETLLAHPGLLNLPASRPWIVKTYFLLCLAGGVIGLLFMILADIRIPITLIKAGSGH